MITVSSQAYSKLYFSRKGVRGGCLFEFGDLFMQCMLTTRPTMFREVQFLGSFGLVSLGDVVEVTANGAFQA